MTFPQCAGAIESKRRRRAAALGALLAGVAWLAATPPSRSLSFNRSASMPVGLYELRHVDRPLARGDEVVVCAPASFARIAVARGYLEAGRCSADAAPLLKLVAAVAGDVVELHTNSIAVNGRCLSSGVTYFHDAKGRAIPHVPRARYHLEPHELWLWAPAARSLDSRYFGSLYERSVHSLAAPLFVLPRRAVRLTYAPCRSD